MGKQSRKKRNKQTIKERIKYRRKEEKQIGAKMKYTKRQRRKLKARALMTAKVTQNEGKEGRGEGIEARKRRCRIYTISGNGVSMPVYVTESEYFRVDIF